jgi:tripartite-type tricarboxylate transporter receptor subunit TctC
MAEAIMADLSSGLGEISGGPLAPNRAFARCVAVGATLAISAATGAEYPTKPIRLIVPSAPGGSPDINARWMANELSRQMGQQVVVDNRAGAAGIVAYEMLARAAADGYTFSHTSFNFVTNPSVYSKLPYDTTRDFQPIIQATYVTDLLAVSPSLPVRSVKELIENAKANPDKLSYGSTTGPSAGALEMELFKQMTGTRIARVTYKGMQQATTDVISGQVHMVCDNLPSILPHVKAGRVRALGVTTLKRSLVVPDLPTLDEAGVTGFERTGWNGYLAPSRIPREIVMRLNTEINKALSSPTIRAKTLGVGRVLVGGTPEQFAALIRAEIDKWGTIIRTLGMKAD